MIFWIAAVVACVSWTVTHEEIFRPWRERCKKHIETAHNLFVRDENYVWTCEYCFSHWVTFVALCVTRYRLVYGDWRGYVVALFAIVALANLGMTLYQWLRASLRWIQAKANTEEFTTKGVEYNLDLAKQHKAMHDAELAHKDQRMTETREQAIRHGEELGHGVGYPLTDQEVQDMIEEGSPIV